MNYYDIYNIYQNNVNLYFIFPNVSSILTSHYWWLGNKASPLTYSGIWFPHYLEFAYCELDSWDFHQAMVDMQFVKSSGRLSKNS